VHDQQDEPLTQDVTIVMYPAIYIIGDKSAHFSVFVNGHYNKGNTNNLGNNTTHPYYSINGHQVGKAFGYASDDQHMHVISVSSFNSQIYQFDLSGTKYPYIIGDPRSRESNTFDVPNVPNGRNGWVEAFDVNVNGNKRYLQNYYTTSKEDGSFQLIAPKFRISSKLAGYSHCSIDDLAPAIRCASYQEDGFPAGRWRLPTTAEVQFVIMLQNNDKIQELFVGDSNYCSATHTINNNNNNVRIWPGIQKGENNKSTVSVRCVYDEWYWGSKREAWENTTYSANGGYQFTWGDRKVY
jgi:hypothetical protein